MSEIEESSLHVSSSYGNFDELWNGFLAGVGPAGAYCVSLAPGDRQRLRDALRCGLDSPAGEFTLGALARCVVARVPQQ